MSNAVGLRYAKALFELAKETKTLDAVDKSLTEFSETLETSNDLAAFLSSPLLSREVQQSAITEIAKKAKMDGLVANTLGLMAQKRRLAMVPDMIVAFGELIAKDRGEASAEIISASKLTAAQEKKLAAALKKQLGRDVNLTSRVDESLIGGLIVKMGSTMIDGSVRGKLSKLHNAMKEVG